VAENMVFGSVLISTLLPKAHWIHHHQGVVLHPIKRELRLRLLI
jgi:hypothetical protein